MSNFSFLIKSSLMQVISVSLGSTPVPCLVTLILIELVYFLQNLGYYSKNRHLKSVFLILPKLIQSAFLLIVEVSIFTSVLNLKSPKFALPVSTQKFLT